MNLIENNKKTKLVSIIIPVYNREHLVKDTLESIKNQTYKNWECIIVDDGSTDNTYIVIEDFIKNDSRFSLWKRPVLLEKGHCSCRNYGFEISNGEYVNWFDSDDIMHEDFIFEKMKQFSLKDYDFVSCEIAEFVEDLSSSRKILNNYEDDILSNYFIGKISFYSVCAMWKKDFLIKHNLFFDNKLIPLEDWKLNIDVLLITENYFLLKKVLIYYRMHDTSISSKLANYDNQLILQEFYCRKNMYSLFKQKNILRFIVTEFYTKRLLFLLRALLINKNIKSISILFEILKTQKVSLKIKTRTVIGFVSFWIFRKGYRFLK